MELPLIYPCGKLKSVRVGVFKIKIIKDFFNSNLRLSGNLPFKILASICLGTKPEDFENITVLDANRIIFKAYKQSNMSEVYTAKIQCKCGKVNCINHQLETNYEKSDIYDKEFTMEAVDPETVEVKSYKVRLTPLKLRIQMNTLLAVAKGLDDIDLPEESFYYFIESVDGKKELGELPHLLYKKSAELNAKEDHKVAEMTTIITKCEKCEKEISSSIGIHDGEFLQS